MQKRRMNQQQKDKDLSDSGFDNEIWAKKRDLFLNQLNFQNSVIK